MTGEEAERKVFVSEEDQGRGEAGWKRAMTSSCSEKGTIDGAFREVEEA